MKYFLTLIMFSLIFASCKKDKNNNQPKTKQETYQGSLSCKINGNYFYSDKVIALRNILGQINIIATKGDTIIEFIFKDSLTQSKYPVKELFTSVSGSLTLSKGGGNFKFSKTGEINFSVYNTLTRKIKANFNFETYPFENRNNIIFTITEGEFDVTHINQ